MFRALVVSLTALLTLTSVAGCDLPQMPGAAKPHPTTSATSAAPEYLGEPKVGECHNLTFKDIGAESDTKKPVDCSGKHTTQTVTVVQDAPAAMSKGSDNARAYAIGKACGAGIKDFLGGDAETRAKTLYALAWFAPTKEQKAKGADWMRCDVTLTDQVKAYPLKGDAPLLADEPSKTELRCGRIDPKSDSSFELVSCATKHQFVPKQLIKIDDSVRWKDAEAGAKAACEANGPLYSWSHAEQWGTGDRFYVCWDIIAGSLKDLEDEDVVVV